MLRPWVEAAPLGSPWDSAITLFQLLWLDPDSSPQRCASLSWRWLDMMQWIVYGDDAVEMIRWQLQKKNLAPCNLHSSIYFVCLTAATTRAPSCLLHFQGLDCSGLRYPPPYKGHPPWNGSFSQRRKPVLASNNKPKENPQQHMIFHSKTMFTFEPH